MTKKIKRLITLLTTTFIFMATFTCISITVYAQTTITEGTVYWETSENGGSGNFNSVYKDNPYITEDRGVIVNGYSYLDKEGNIIDSFYDSSLTDDIKLPKGPEGAEKVMLHVHSKTNRLGWVDGGNVLFDLVTPEPSIVKEQDSIKDLEPEIDDNKKTPEEFVDSINKKEGKTLVLVDKSQSMSDFIDQSTSAFNSLDSTNITVMVFASGTVEVAPEDVNSYPANGSSTNIYGALNQAKDIYENVVLISDLGHNEIFSRLKKNDTVKTVEIMCPEEVTDSISEKIEKKWSNATIEITTITD